MANTQCVFCAIITGELDAFKLYEDDRVIVILDQSPVRQGHAMVIPKHHIEHFVDLDDALAAHIVITGNLIGKKIQSRLKPLRIGFVVSGFGVPHVHYHIIPMWHENDITSQMYASIENGQIVYSMKNTPIADRHMQEELRQLLS